MRGDDDADADRDVPTGWTRSESVLWQSQNTRRIFYSSLSRLFSAARHKAAAAVFFFLS